MRARQLVWGVLVATVALVGATACSGESTDESTGATARPGTTVEVGDTTGTTADGTDPPPTSTTTTAPSPGAGPGGGVPTTPTAPTTPAPGPGATGAPEDGTYAGGFGPDAFASLDPGATLVRDEVTLVVAGGQVTRLTGAYRVEGLATESGADGVRCRSTLTADLTADARAPLVDRAVEVPVALRIAQSVGTPVTGQPCDPGLAGEDTVAFTARVAVDGDRATVLLLSHGQVAFDLALTR